jgi:hypothetical protein
MRHRIFRCATPLAFVGLAACASAPTLDLPPRPVGAPTGSEFARAIEDLDLEARDARIVDEVLSGNVPGWLRRLSPVAIGEGAERVEFWVTPDYLAVGSDSDYLLTPMSPQAAQRIADRLAMSMPTPRMVDGIWAAAAVKLTPAPIPPSPEMTTVPVFVAHSDSVRRQRASIPARLGALTAGHKKDVVLSRDLGTKPGRVAIYGWHQRNGDPIQPRYLGHTDDWVDYSHGIRLVDRTIRVSGASMDLVAVLRDPALAGLVSREGAFPAPPRYE